MIKVFRGIMFIFTFGISEIIYWLVKDDGKIDKVFDEIQVNKLKPENIVKQVQKIQKLDEWEEYKIKLAARIIQLEDEKNNTIKWKLETKTSTEDYQQGKTEINLDHAKKLSNLQKEARKEYDMIKQDRTIEFEEYQKNNMQERNINCVGLCSGFSVKKPKHSTRKEAEQKHCKLCNVWYNSNVIRCECCSSDLISISRKEL